jgi:orotidine-5'-phosphate decarboxylase
MENKNYNEMREKLILGLDVDDSAMAYDMIEKLAPHVKFYKVGLQLITKEGPKIIMTLRRKGLKIFYDAKFYDIPQTVYNACYEAARLGVNMVNVHALGGPKMIQYAKEGLEKASAKLQLQKPKLLAVTILTSYENKDLKKYMKINLPIKDMVLHLAKMAKKSGADGIVCSPEETRIIKKELGKDFIVVTPGIRMGRINKDDQKRIKTPYEAIKDGSDYIVVGRPILQAEDKQAAIMEIIAQIQEGYKHARKSH